MKKMAWQEFKIACKYGQSKATEKLIHKSTEFNIDLNARDEDGKTAFHFACRYGRKDVVEMMVNNADFFKIDLKAKDKDGKTGFQYAVDNFHAVMFPSWNPIILNI